MNRALGIAGLAVFAVGLSGGAMTAQSAKISKPSAADQAFVKRAAGSGMAEVMLGKLAVEKGSTEAVKNFGQMMIDDHTKANEELAGIGKDKGIALPNASPPDAKKLQAKLVKLNGAAFDQLYISEMVKGHKTVVADFKKESTMAKDSDIKDFALKTLPVIEGHISALAQIQAAKAAPDQPK